MISLSALISDLIFWDYNSNSKDGWRSTQLFNLGCIFSTPVTVSRVPKMTVIALSDLS